MSLAEYSDLQTTAGLVSFFSIGLGAGFATDVLAPVPKDDDSTAALLIQAGAQSGASFMILTQLARLIMPARDDWHPPCSDASAVVGVILAQPKLRRCLELLLGRLDDATRTQLGLLTNDASPVPVEPLKGAEA
jgi:hypothetical protein